MTWKPMLASHCKDTSKLKFPVLVSKKLDGVRATFQGGQLLSRSLKPIPNENVQAMFKGLPEGVDGELVYDSPTSPTAYRDTVSIVMSDDKPADGIRLHVFDRFSDAGFKERLALARNVATGFGVKDVVFVEHTLIHTLEELDAYEADALVDGFEGVMVRSLDGPYKQGRSSEREQYLLKLKRFDDMESKIQGAYELMHNSNESFTNELGRTARSSEQAGKVGMDTLGGLIVVGQNGPYNGIEFSVGTGFDAQTRAELWADRKSLIGRIVKIKYFPTGSKDRPRHPVWLGFRDERDM